MGVHEEILKLTTDYFRKKREQIEKDMLCIFRKERRKGKLRGRVTRQKVSKLNLQVVYIQDTERQYIGICKNGFCKPYYKKDVFENSNVPRINYSYYVEQNKRIGKSK